MAKSIKVRIKKNGWIPFINKMGPIQYPVSVSTEVYENLLKLGFIVEPVDAPKIPVVTKPKDEYKAEVPEVRPVEDTVVLEPAVSSPEVLVDQYSEANVNNNVEQPVEETTVIEEEILVDDPNLSADAFYTAEFLTSKAVCKKILNARQVQYNDDSSLNFLRKKVEETNPEVDLVI